MLFLAEIHFRIKPEVVEQTPTIPEHVWAFTRRVITRARDNIEANDKVEAALLDGRIAYNDEDFIVVSIQVEPEIL